MGGLGPLIGNSTATVRQQFGNSTVVNFIAHSHVVLRAGGGWEVAFGAALPDLASMAGTRLDRSLLSPAVAGGVALHHRVDRVFHLLGAFHAGSAQIRDALEDAGVPLGPARAVGHAGYELLLDGCLLTRAGVPEEFTQVLAGAPDVSAATSADGAGRWRSLLAAMRDDRWWLDYRDPQQVARALQRRLQARRLLQFSEAQLPVVTEVLAAARPGVDAGTDEVVRAVAEAIRPDGPPARGGAHPRPHQGAAEGGR